MKKFIISTTPLAVALKKLSLAILKSGPLPALSNIYVKASQDQVILIASDIEITIHYKLSCECKAEFDFLVPFEFLNKVVALNKNCPLTFELGKTLKITDETDTYEVKSPEKVETFPKLQELPRKSQFSINEDILHCLHTALSTAINLGKQPQTEFVLMNVEGKNITVASSDNASMVFSRRFPLEVEDAQELLLSPKIIKALEGCKEAKVYYQKKVIGFEADHITIVNTRSEMKYGDFRKVFPPDWPANLVINRHELLEALGKCSISSDPLRTTDVDLSAAGTIVLIAEDGVVRITPTVKCQYTGEIKQTKINSDKLMKLLHQVNYDEISFAIHDMNKQIVLSSKDDEGYLAMIMPIAQTVKK